MIFRRSITTSIVLALVASGHSFGADWSRFRGPNGTGVSESIGLPTTFGPEENVRWQVKSGAGSSSPVIAGNRLFYTSYQDDERTAHCLDASTGKELWKRTVKKRRDENASAPNGPATCSPATDGRFVVVFYPDTGLVCYTLDGKELWNKDLGPFHSMHGVAGSPVIENNKVLLQADQLRGSFLAALDVSSGNELWRVERLDGLTGAYSTPSLTRSASGEWQVIASGPQELIGYDLETGKVAWTQTGATNAPVSVPVVVGSRVFVCEPVGERQSISMLAPLDQNNDAKFGLDEVKNNVAIFRLLERIDKRWGNNDGVVVEDEWDKAFGGFLSKGGLVAVDLLRKGTGTESVVRWDYKKAVPYVPSILVYRQVVYFVQDGGIVTTVSADTGEVLKRSRLKKGGKRFYSSPVAADGKVFLVDTEGELAVLRAGPEWEVLATNSLGEPCFASPAISGGKLYVRTQKKLYCFGAES